VTRARGQHVASRIMYLADAPDGMDEDNAPVPRPLVLSPAYLG
jgi:hypothetical protein